MDRPTQLIAILSHGLIAAAALAAQEPPRATVSRLAAVEAAVVSITGAHRDAIWPGFRPDTIPVLYVVPDAGVLLLNWPAVEPPDGFARIAGVPRAGWQSAAARSAASTNTSLAGRSAAQVVVFADADDALLFGTTVHEAFHVFERSRAREGRRFGSGENSFLVTSYPVFDQRNEAGVAFEGRLLARAVAARTREELREAAQEFVAAREARHRVLGREFADFEAQAELNEGLAEYALVRALELAADDPAFPWRADAAAEVAHHRARLDSLTSNVSQSLRLRFYLTGPAIGAILDRLAGPQWRSALERDDLTLQDELAEASGYRDQERLLLARAARAVDTAALAREAGAAIARLRAARRAQMDSILARPGLLLTLRADSLPGRGFGLCGFDPQNLLQVDSTVLLHTRWVRLCGGVSGEFTTAAIQDRDAGTFSAVVGAEDSVRVTAGGNVVTLREGESLVATAIKVTAPGATLE
ncbi:MAG TPA: hypothetical protein VMT21_00285, partial [Gemmatimonadales bacterium]|nr:hypothetical protein [Gemmatimonadales bacterium]